MVPSLVCFGSFVEGGGKLVTSLASDYKTSHKKNRNLVEFTYVSTLVWRDLGDSRCRRTESSKINTTPVASSNPRYKSIKYSYD